jgi:hypothetical protein
MKKNLGTLGDLLKDGKPLKEYIEEQTGIEATKEFTSDVKKLNGLVKGKIKERFTPKYNTEPSNFKKWNKKEISRRNVMSINNLPEENSPLENMIGCMQELKEFTVRQLLAALKSKDEKWLRSKVVYELKKVNQYLSDEFENFPALISKKSVVGKHEFIYKTTDEFNSTPKQYLCELIATIKTALKVQDIDEQQSKVPVIPIQEDIKKETTQNEPTIIKGQLLEAEPVEANLIELVRELRPGSVIKKYPDGTLTIVVM